MPYTPGELKAVARKDGEVMATHVIQTAGTPEKFDFETDQTELNPRDRDLAYLTIRVEDAEGNFHPKAARWVSIQIKGPARILGVHNGDPLSHEPFQSRTVKTFNGLARVILAATTGKDTVGKNEEREPGEIVVTARVRGWESKTLRLRRTHEGTEASVFPPDNSAPRPTDVYDEGVPPVD